MPRNRHRRSRQKPGSKRGDGPVWTNTHHLELWAFLNWCIQHNKDFDTLVIDHLKKRTKKKFTLSQIHEKLRREWRIRRACNAFSDIYSQGTAGLEPFGVEDQIELEKIFSKLEKSLPRRDRFLRSASAACVLQPLASPATPTRRPRQANAPSPPQPHELRNINQTPRRWVRAQTLRPERREPERHLNQDEPVQKNDVCEISSDTDSSLLESANSVVNVGPDIPGLEDNAPDDTQAAFIASMQTDIRNLKAELVKARGREITLLNHIFKLEKEKRHREERDRIKGSDVTMLKNSMFRYKVQIESQNNLIDDFKALETDTLAFPRSSFEKDCNALYEDISTEIANFICNLSINDDLPEQQSGFPPLIDSWARKVCDADMGGILVHAHKVNIPKTKLVASVLTAGISELVFESVFPEILAVESPLFTEYKRIIRYSAGRKIARNIDLSGKKNVFFNANVKEDEVSNKAKWLCSVMLQSLDLFLPLESRDMIERSPDKLSPEEDLALSALENGLTKALAIKLELELTLKRFKYFFFKPGTLFHREMMKCDDLVLPADGIRLCISPALFFLPDGDEEVPDDDESEATSHGGLMEARFNELKSLVLIVKARVLL
ncbi:hypothetical protein IL306_009923 [Fusarium sp. DS 682]|nr:hypothetical protein IL306_009923 [Fusarium sp. DS 682]